MIPQTRGYSVLPWGRMVFVRRIRSSGPRLACGKKANAAHGTKPRLHGRMSALNKKTDRQTALYAYGSLALSDTQY